MPEIVDAFERSGHYFGVLEIRLAETSKQFEFGISLEGYRALRKILQLRPFDQRLALVENSSLLPSTGS